MTRYVDITPDVSLMAKIGQSGHSVADAVAELVDNAIDARIGAKRVTVHVRFNVREGWLEVEDDAAGMTEGQLARALVLGLSTKAQASIGRFGLGLKTACTSLGPRFQVITCTEGSQTGSVAEYDQDKFVMDAAWRLPIRRLAKKRARGTTVRISTSRLYPALQGTLVRTLGWTFRHFIEDRVVSILVNSTRVESTHHQVDASSVVGLDGDVEGRRVRGWTGLLVTSSQRGWYGFDLVRNRRIIRRHEKVGFLPHPATARVVGELHLDEFATNNLKTDFIRETSEWDALERWLSEQVSPVVAASRALAHGVVLTDHVGRLQPSRHLNGHDPIGQDVALMVGAIHVIHRFVLDQASPYVVIEKTLNGPSLCVSTNLSYPLSSSERPELQACRNLAEAVALHAGTRNTFVEIKSEVWLSLVQQRRLLSQLRAQVRGHLRGERTVVA